MTIGKTGIKMLSAFSVVLVILIILVGVVSYILLTIYQPPRIYNIGEIIKTEHTELTINSVKISDKVVGYRESITAGIISGNQTAHPKEGFKFIILGLKMENKENTINPVLGTDGMRIESNRKNIYDGSSIQGVFEKRIRTYATDEEMKEFFCEDYPEVLPSESSMPSCIIFRIPENEEPSKFFYIQDGKILFVVDLVI